MVVIGSDGLFDNLFEEDVIAEAPHGSWAPHGPLE